MEDIHEKVYNGYGLRTSKLSVTNIGQYNIEAAAIQERELAQKAALKRSAIEEIQKSKTNHPSKLNLHMQKEYPNTLQRLRNGDLTRAKTPPNLKSFNDPGFSVQVSNVDMSVTQRTVEIADWNNRKREYNKSMSNQAVVNQIMCGLGSQRKEPLFPQGASHVQLLGIDGRLVGKQASEPAPEVAKRNRWLGDDVGWENNRGLKAEHPSFEDGKSERWPNPANWNKRPGPLMN